MLEFRAYIDSLIETKRGAEPETDLVAALMHAGEGGKLTAEELTAMFVILLFAGHETTTNLLGIGLLELHRQPDQWRQLCSVPSSVSQSIDELLRFTSPVQFVPRIALEPISIGDVHIAAGESVLPIIGSANHDSAVFPEPEKLDLARPNARNHLAFGYGGHFCLGNHLAKLEAAIVFAALSERFPDMAVDTEMAEFGGSLGLRALVSLPTRLGGARGARGLV
jgi:cytochrome P450